MTSVRGSRAQLESVQRPAVAEAAPATSPHDVRRKPLAFAFLLRFSTLRMLVRVASLLVLDYAGLFGAIFTGLGLKAVLLDESSAATVLDQTRAVVPFTFLLTALLFSRSHLYADRPSRPGATRIIASLFQVTLLALAYALANHQHFTSYYIFYGSLTFAVAYVCVLRWLHLRASGWLLGLAGYRRRTVIAGSDGHIEAVAQALRDGKQGSSIDVLGYVAPTSRPESGLRSLGSLDDIPRVLAEQHAQEVVIADPDFPEERAVALVDACHRQGVTVYAAPSTMEVLVRRAAFVPGQSVPLFVLKPPVFEGLDYVLKRGFDLVVASVLLAILSPLLLGIAAAVKLGSRGPVVYRSLRAGIGERPFDCLKFRTMREGADAAQIDLEGLNEASGALFKIRTDPRLTPTGRLLRRFSLDELPQLLNVLRGQMSLVGPRPLPMRDYGRLEAWHKKRYLVLPGMTGLWQVSGRSELDFDDLVRLDFLYLERWSVFLDLVILLKTVPAVISRRGAF